MEYKIQMWGLCKTIYKKERGVTEMTFTLIADEVSALERYKEHCEHTGENIDRLLDANGTGDIGYDCMELEWIYADTARGIELQADHNTQWWNIRIIQDMEKRYAEYKDKEVNR